MDWLTEPFSLALQQRALIAGVLVALSTSAVGTWVVIRGMTFLGDALVHGVVPGIALSILLGIHPLIGAAAAALVMVGGISLVHRQTTFSEDTGIGLLFVGMLAVGVMLVSRTTSYSGNLMSLLFGDALGVGRADLVVSAVIAVVVVVSSVLWYRPFMALSFDRRKAQLLGMHPALAHGVLLALITLAIVGSFQSVGTLLVFGLLVGPPATAALLARRVPMIMLLGAVIGVLSVVAGLVISYHADLAASATMALIPVTLFFVVLATKQASAKRAPTPARH